MRKGFYMEKIEKLDSNFKILTDIQREGLHFYDIETGPFRIYGISRDGDRFRRMPEHIAKTVNQGVAWFHSNTAGGRVRFVTNSPYVAIHAQMDKIVQMPHFAFTGSTGFDLYMDEGQGMQFVASFLPPLDMKAGYESLIEIPGAPQKRLFMIHFPPYCDVKKMYVGLDQNAVLEPASDYHVEAPIIYYGSSITHGACASRPGNSYEAIISRKLDCNFVNLGFGGNAKGERTMAEYLASLKMCAFVLDYDYNAPDTGHLAATHEPLFQCVREKNPDVPIIMMTRPRFRLTQEEQERLVIVKKTFENARAAGDSNVYFIPGNDLIPEEMEEIATVDGTHPNDCGFACMAYSLIKLLQEIVIA